MKLGGKKIRYKLRKLKVKTWQLFIILIPLLIIDATLLRLGHIKMTELRDAVLSADAAEDDALIAESLTKLKNFVFNNVVINIVEENGEQRITFGTGPFYLEHQYTRAATAALKQAEETMSSDSNPYGNIYKLASDACREPAIAHGWAWDNPNYINCMVSEIGKYPASDEIQDKIMASLPSTELYRHNYASPLFVPTFTCFFIILTLIIIVVIFIRVIIWLILRLSLLFL